MIFPLNINPPRITLALHQQQQSFLRSCRESWEYQCMPSSPSPLIPITLHFPLDPANDMSHLSDVNGVVITVIQVYLYTNTPPTFSYPFPPLIHPSKPNSRRVTYRETGTKKIRPNQTDKKQKRTSSNPRRGKKKQKAWNKNGRITRNQNRCHLAVAIFMF